MSQSAAVSIKSLLTVGLLAGSLIAVVVLLESPGWRGAASGVLDVGDGVPRALPPAAGDARPLNGEMEAMAAGRLPDEFDADPGDGAASADGAVLALGLDESSAGGVVAAVGDASDDASLEETSALPVFWGEMAAAGALLPADSADAEAEPGLLSAGADSSALPADALDRFSELERRLRELGATQYRLETWGADGELFRFRCWMAISATERYNRFFAATDADALTAFEKVLHDVEQWRANQTARPQR